MPKLTRRRFVGHAAGALVAGPALLRSRSGFAQGADGFPNRPVRFVVPLAAGGAIDFIARAVGERMSQTIGQQVVVENRTGAGGTIGMDMAMKSPADGYTILITNDNAASAPHIMKLAHDYTKEMRPVCFLGRHGQVLAAHATLGVSSVTELVEYATKNPGLGMATSGVGSNQHVLCEWFKREAGVRIDHVPYRGAGQAINDLIAAHVKTAILGPTSMMQHYKAGTLKLLAQSSARRGAAIPDVPTFVEAGFRDLVLEAWYGAFVPGGTPPAIVARLNAAMNTALKDEKLKDTFFKGAIDPVGGTPEEFGKLAQADSQKYERLTRELNVRIN